MSDPNYPFLKPESDGNVLGQLAHFRVVRLLGEGGMGYVFEAIDERLRRTIALKVMKPQVAAGPDREARFLREAQALAAVRHPNVATIYEIGVDAGVPFLAMEKLSGQTLESRLADLKPMSVEEILSMGAEISDGLKAIHDAGIIHRDIKPANIWLEKEKGIAKVIDFGLAQADDWTLRKNTSGNVAGTPQYMSPEQVRGEPLTEQSDLYSLGVLLFHALSGRMPHDEPDVHRQLAAIVARAPTKLADAKKDLPIPLCRLVDRLLAKDLTSRPKSADEVRAELIVLRNERLAFRQAGTSLNLILGKVSRFIVSPVTVTTVASILLPACVVFASAGWIWRPTIVHNKVDVTVPALTLELPSLRNVSPALRRQVEIPLTGQHGRVFGLATCPRA